jgi:hypothetical protein
MAHHNRPSAAGGCCGVPGFIARTWLQKCWLHEQIGKCQGSGLWLVFSPAQDAALIGTGQRSLLPVQGSLRLLPVLLDRNILLYKDQKKQISRAQHAAVKDELTNEHRLNYLEFAKSNMGFQWVKVIFSDLYIWLFKWLAADSLETTGRVLQSSIFVSLHMQRWYVYYWVWIFHEGTGIHHCIEEHLFDLQYKHSLKYSGTIWESALSESSNPVP